MRQLVLLVLASVFTVTLNAQKKDIVINNNKFIFTSNVAVSDTLGVIVKGVSKFTSAQEKINIDYYSMFIELHPSMREGVSDAKNIMDVLVVYADIWDDNQYLDSIYGGRFYEKIENVAVINNEVSKTNETQYVFVPVKTYLENGKYLTETVEFSFIQNNQIKYIDIDLKGFLKKVVDTDFGKVELKLFGQHYTAAHIETGKTLFDYRSDVVLNVK